MFPELKTLIQLQEMDLEILSINEKKEQAPKRLNILKENVDEKTHALKELNEKFKEIHRKKTELDDELEMERLRLSKSQARLSQLKTNREYQALLKEIEETKRLSKEREDEILAIMEDSEKISNDMEAIKGEIDALNKEIKAEEKNVKEIEKELDKGLNEIQKKRDALSKNLRKDLLERYNFLREKRAGVAVSQVKGQACGGCNMNLPPQLYNELLREEKIHYCPVCQRIIYVSKESEV